MFRSYSLFALLLLTGEYKQSIITEGDHTTFASAFVTPTFNMGNTQTGAVRSCLQMSSGDSAITGVFAREILDSRGNPTVEVRCDAYFPF